MRWAFPLLRSTIIKRYKRFLVDVELDDGQLITAHCPNSGRMTTCLEPGWTAWVSHHDDPKRKLAYTLQMTESQGEFITVNTMLANKIVYEFFTSSSTFPFSYDQVQAEVKYDANTRFDFLLSKQGAPPHYVEVKSVSYLKEQGFAQFPDAPSIRGQKHLRKLIEATNKGFKSSLIFVLNRKNVNFFGPAQKIDPAYSTLLKQAKTQGVHISAYRTLVNKEEYTLQEALDETSLII